MRSSRIISTEISFSLTGMAYLSGWTEDVLIAPCLLFTWRAAGKRLREGHWVIRRDNLFVIGRKTTPTKRWHVILPRPRRTYRGPHHTEIHSCLMLGTVPSTTLSRPQPTLAMSIKPLWENRPWVCMPRRLWTVMTRLDTCFTTHKPLVAPKGNEILKIDAFRRVLTYRRHRLFWWFNQEDSLLFSKAFIERGGFRSTTYRTYVSTQGGSTGYRLAKPERKHQRYARDYTYLDDDGLPSIGTPGRRAWLSGRVGNDGHDASLVYPKNDAVIDDVIVFDNQEGGVP